jgi:hypothetical protein
VCAFLRGEDVLVVVRVRAGAGGGEVEVPDGRWRDVLGAGGVAGGGDAEPAGGELEGGRVAVESPVAGPWPGLGLYERI